MLLTLDGAFYRRLAVTAAALIVYRLGCAVPVPGLSTDLIGQLLRSSGLPPASVSVCALGVMPLITVLILAELLRTIAPGVRRWEQANPATASSPATRSSRWRWPWRLCRRPASPARSKASRASSSSRAVCFAPPPWRPWSAVWRC